MDFTSLTTKKTELDRYRPLPDALVQNLNEWFRVELTYTSNAIEGNTLSRRETALVVEKGRTVGGKTLVEHLEAINHVAALDWVQQMAMHKPSVILEDDILTLHGLILKGIDDANAGHYRHVSVRISGSRVVLPNPLKVPELMQELVTWIRTAEGLHPVHFAAEAHYRLVTIHPFVDGNGRTARLLMNLLLLMQGYPPAIIRIRDRLAYIGALEQAQLGGSQLDYFKLISAAVDRSLDIYLQAVRGEDSQVEKTHQRFLKIGELAKAGQESVPTIRYWTKQGLLPVATTTPSGYQLYAPEALDRIRQIRELKTQRFTLAEIKTKLKQ